VEVRDEEIAAQSEVVKESGCFVEPSSAAASAEKLVSPPLRCPADLDHAQQLLERCSRGGS
jgi:hypothetical protein